MMFRLKALLEGSPERKQQVTHLRTIDGVGSVVGAALVIACGLYLIWRERQQHREVVVAGVRLDVRLRGRSSRISHDRADHGREDQDGGGLERIQEARIREQAARHVHRPQQRFARGRVGERFRRPFRRARAAEVLVHQRHRAAHAHQALHQNGEPQPLALAQEGDADHHVVGDRLLLGEQALQVVGQERLLVEHDLDAFQAGRGQVAA